jgi:hypothetical protein
MVLALGVGCGGDKSCVAGSACAAADGFESDLPNQNSRSADEVRAAAAPAPETASPTSKADGQATAAAGDSAERAIAEADIIQVQGDRLFALSRLAGLAVIDVSQPSALQLLGRYRELPGEPFEMYLRGDMALVMFTGWGQYEKLDSGVYQYVTTSKLLSLDVSNPSEN